jgi:hypothetical protein
VIYIVETLKLWDTRWMERGNQWTMLNTMSFFHLPNFYISVKKKENRIKYNETRINPLHNDLKLVCFPLVCGDIRHRFFESCYFAINSKAVLKNDSRLEHLLPVIRKVLLLSQELVTVTGVL